MSKKTRTLKFISVPVFVFGEVQTDFFYFIKSIFFALVNLSPALNL